MRANGAVCITDFGLARALRAGERAMTVCGTRDYFTPELLQGLGTTRAADIW